MTIDWLTFFNKHTKKYTHFDYPLNVCDKKCLFPEAKKLISFLEDRERIAKHAFFPFIGYDILERRISKIDKTKKYAEQSSIIKKTAHKVCFACGFFNIFLLCCHFV